MWNRQQEKKTIINRGWARGAFHRLFLVGLFASFLVSFGGALRVRADAAQEWPLVTEVRGSAWMYVRGQDKVKLKAKALIRDNTVLETGAQSEVRFELSKDNCITLRENSIIEVPAITWETKEFSYVDLKSGEMVWESKPQKEEKGDMILKNDLLYLSLPKQGQFQFIYRPDLVQIEVRVYEGKMEFAQMNAEVSRTVEAGQKARFQGLRGEAGVEYDVLLKGKKIPKGFLTAIEKMSESELKIFKERERLLQKKQKELKQKELKKFKGPVICSNPPGDFNSCSWVCEQNVRGEKKACRLEKGARCVRHRCNANGQWAEALVLEGGAQKKCFAQPVTEECDY